MANRRACVIVGAVLLPGLLSTSPRALARQQVAGGITFDQALVIEQTGRFRRTPVYTDEIEFLRCSGTLATPQEGQTLTLPGGDVRTWKRIAAGEGGTFRDRALAGGYACLTFESAGARVMLLDATGHSAAYFNGEPRAGDPYGYGKVLCPVHVRTGRNVILLPCGRGHLTCRLVPPARPLSLDTRDLTLPSLVAGEPASAWGANTVINATRAPVALIRLGASVGGRPERLGPVFAISPLAARKAAFPVEAAAQAQPGEVDMEVRLYAEDPAGRRVLDRVTVPMRIVSATDVQARTFISSIDGSVQYYAVRRASAAMDNPSPPALILSLHGAGVEASGQAACYASKGWAVVAAPTNRRSFGFDWEDWGRLDALEVLEDALRTFQADRSRVYLTGHSMGGHGTWHLGATYPDLFAAIGPSAGWVSFWSYTGADRFTSEDPLARIFARAAAPGDTLALSGNFLQHGVYVLHGDQDDNVPVEQARTMRGHLAGFHRDFAYFEQPGAGHWWGNACVDWPPMLDFFRHHVRSASEDVHHVRFATAHPGVSSRCEWITIHSQIHPLDISRVDIRFEADQGAFSGQTENVERLALDPAPMRKILSSRQGPGPHAQETSAVSDAQPSARMHDPQPGAPDGEPVAKPQTPEPSLTLKLDEQTLAGVTLPPLGEAIHLAWIDGAWRVTERPLPREKGPHRCGPFKDAFRHRVMLVHGTSGTPEENEWALAKARFDAETFWYRGNGSVDVVADKDFDAGAEADRNVIVYGHAGMNTAWNTLLADSPIRVESGRVLLAASSATPPSSPSAEPVSAAHTLRGDDLACLFVRPRPGSDIASVAVVAGTGLPGMRLSDRFPYFMSGVAYPDFMVVSTAMLRDGIQGVRAAGYFANDWSLRDTDLVLAATAPSEVGAAP